MYKTIVAVLLLAAVANAQLVGWRNCGSPMAIVHRIRVSGCSVTPCRFPVGQVVTIEVDALSLANSVNLPFLMRGSALGLSYNFIEGNACNHFTIGVCPAITGRDFTFQIQYTVINIVPPGIPILITSIMWNDFGDVAVCIQVDAVIVPNPNEIAVE